MDPLSLLLESMHASTALAMCFRMAVPFAVAKSEVSGIPFRVAEGEPYWLQVGDDDWRKVEPGDLILLPRGDRHVMASDPQVRAVSMGEGFHRLGLEEWREPGPERVDPRVMRFGGDGAVTTIVGGILVFRESVRTPLFEVLPNVIHIRANTRPTLTRLGFALQSLLDEAMDAEAGWRIAVCRLAEVIFVQSLRAHFSLAEQSESNWLAALGDPRIGKALALMHRRFDEGWTVESLACAIGTSRSRLAERFTALLGMSPMAYLLQVRLARAAQELTQGMSVVVTASRCGYASEKAFSRAFQRWFGMPPGRYRHANCYRA
jgi:AraC-like DNA-binding protein